MRVPDRQTLANLDSKPRPARAPLRQERTMQLVSNALAQEAAMGAIMVGYFW